MVLLGCRGRAEESVGISVGPSAWPRAVREAIVKKLIILAVVLVGAAAVWRKVQADRAELDLWTEATTADD